MSSFVIDLDSYVRVAGLVAGISKGTRGTCRELWIYDYDKHRNMIGTDFVDKFVECYKLNVESVCKQYAHNPEYGNPDTYLKDIDPFLPCEKEYVRYFKYGELISSVNDTMALMDAIWEIIHFSRSVSYQIEDPICNQVVMGFFNEIISKLTQLADLKDDRQTWGHFTLHLDKEKALD